MFVRSMLGCAVAAVTVAAQTPPDATSTVPITIPLPLVASIAAPPLAVALPPLVITPPKPPVKKAEPAKVVAREMAPMPAVPVIVVSPKVDAVAVAPPKPETPVRPAVTATPAVLVRPVVKPAIAEIIAVGPKAIDGYTALISALDEAKAAHAKVRDYSGHVIVQDRVKSKLLPEQTAEIRVRTKPKSIALKFIAPSSEVGRELIHVEGRFANAVRAKAAGTYGPLAFANLPLTDAKTAATARHTVVEIGLGPVLDRLDKALAMEFRLRNTVSVTVADFTFAGKTVTRFEIKFERSHALRDAAKMIVCFDPDTKLPVRLEIHDGDLREAMSFVNLSFNQGLGDGPFEK